MITELKDNEIFVFGSNLLGYHGAGAAKTALGFGAEYGNPIGLQGKTYAIPTKSKLIRTLPLENISKYISEFIEFANNNKHLKFLVTEIGCGLAGLTPQQIAPLFKEALNCENIKLPKRFIEILK